MTSSLQTVLMNCNSELQCNSCHKKEVQNQATHMDMKKENTMKIDALEAMQFTTSTYDVVSATTFTTVLIKQVSAVRLHIRSIVGQSEDFCDTVSRD